jgi:hypothetical protein
VVTAHLQDVPQPSSIIVNAGSVQHFLMNLVHVLWQEFGKYVENEGSPAPVKVGQTFEVLQRSNNARTSAFIATMKLTKQAANNPAHLDLVLDAIISAADGGPGVC